MEIYYQKALHRCRVKQEFLTNEYVCYLLFRLAMRGGFSGSVTSATIAHLTNEKLKNLKIPVPPIDLQRAFSLRIAEIHKIKAHHCVHLAKLDALFDSLQHRAFTGEL